MPKLLGRKPGAEPRKLSLFSIYFSCITLYPPKTPCKWSTNHHRRPQSSPIETQNACTHSRETFPLLDAFTLSETNKLTKKYRERVVLLNYQQLATINLIQISIALRDRE